MLMRCITYTRSVIERSSYSQKYPRRNCHEDIRRERRKRNYEEIVVNCVIRRLEVERCCVILV